MGPRQHLLRLGWNQLADGREPRGDDNQTIFTELGNGLPVIVNGFNDASGAIGVPGGGAFAALGDMSWYIPEQLASCTAAQLTQAFPGAGHSVNIVGYYVVGSLSTPDPIHSYFIIENNWGKSAGY